MDLMALLTSPDTYVSLAVLTVLEIVLGIDNIVFITILAGRIPGDSQTRARRIGITVALVSRLALLAGIGWVLRLETTLFSVMEHAFSGKDLILVAGGLFLLAKATHEIYENVERPAEHQPQGFAGDQPSGKPSKGLYAAVLLQIFLLDMVFSIDSVITGVGMVRPDQVPIIALAMVISVVFLLFAAGPVGNFVQRHASIRVLALAFLVLIGFLLVTEGFGQHIPKGYVYFSMAFSLGMELLNMRMRSRRERLLARLSDPAAS